MWAVVLPGVDGLATEKLAIVASTVSSKMVQQMARQEGFTFVECLTGAGPRSQLPAQILTKTCKDLSILETLLWV